MSVKMRKRGMIKIMLCLILYHMNAISLNEDGKGTTEIVSVPDEGRKEKAYVDQRYCCR